MSTPSPTPTVVIEPPQKGTALGQNDTASKSPETVQAVVIAAPPVDPAAPQTRVEVDKTVAKVPADRIPANWSLKPLEGADPQSDMIEGLNNVTNRHFEGTVADFNKFLRE